MKLFVLAEDFYPNVSGGARTRWEFCRGAVERGHEVVAFTPHEANLPKSETVDGVRIERPQALRVGGSSMYAPSSTVTRLFLSPLFFLSVLSTVYRGEDTPEVVLSTSNSMHWMAWLLNLVPGIEGSNFIGYSPLVDPDRHSWLRLLFARVNAHLFLTDSVFCRSVSVREYLGRRVGVDAQILHGIIDEERIRSVASTVSTAAVRDSIGISADERLLVSVGRLVPIKRPLAAVDIVNRLDAAAALVIVGDGPLFQEISTAVTDRGCADQVTLLGEVPPEEALKYIAVADGLLLTSVAESYSSVALEALALGTPVYGTPVGILQHLNHERLHTGTVDELPALLSERPGSHTVGCKSVKNFATTGWRISSRSYSRQYQQNGSGPAIDETILSNYSMSRFTEDLLQALSDRAEEVAD